MDNSSVNGPLVSIVIPVYNGEKFVKKTIESVLLQSYLNIEVIIIDDASTDQSRDIIESFSDQRIKRVYNERNLHICESTNKGVANAKGTYICLLGHDDILEKDKIKLQVEYLESHTECGICFTWSKIIDQKDQIIKDTQEIHYKIFHQPSIDQKATVNHLFFYGNKFCGSSCLIRKKVWEQMGGYHLGMIQFQDYDMWLKICTKYESYIIPQELVRYRIFLDDSHVSLDTNSLESILRKNHEYNYLKWKYIGALTDVEFQYYFEDIIRKSNIELSYTTAEVQCAKTFILKEMENPYFLNSLLDLLMNEETRMILKNKFQIGLKDVYKITGLPIQMDCFASIQEEQYRNVIQKQSQLIEKQKEQIVKQKDKIEQQIKVIGDAENFIQSVTPMIEAYNKK